MPIRLLVKSRAQNPNGVPPELVVDKDAICVGREQGCDLLLPDPVISRRHLNIVRDGPLYFLEDAGSSYGTRVNGAVLPKGEKRLLRNGDVIAVGPYDLTFDRVAEAEPDSENTNRLAKKVVKSALRGMAAGAGPVLRVMNGPLEGTKLEIHDAQEIVIGREEGVDLLVDDDLVSRRHVKVRRDWEGTHLEDLKSRNGIKLNKRRVLQATLKDGDEIEVGRTRLLYLDPREVREGPVLEPPPAALSEPNEAPEEALEEGAAEASAEEQAGGEEEQAGAEAEGAEEAAPPAAAPAKPPEASKVSKAEAPPAEEEGTPAAPDEEEPPPAAEEPPPEEPARAPGGMPSAGAIVPIIVVGLVAVVAIVFLALLFASG